MQVLDASAFAVMVVMAVVMTCLVSPVVTMVYRPLLRQDGAPYKRRTVHRAMADGGELRLLACVHGPRNLPAVLTLVESAHPTKKAPVSLHSLHLVELTGRSTAMLIVHNTRRPAAHSTSDHIVAALELFEQSSPAVSVHPLTAVSPYTTMHQDICTLAQDKRVALLLLPFHKDLTVDGGMEATNPAFRALNLNVLSAAPCSVGIVVDRDLAARAGGRHHSNIGEARRVVVLFFGGADYREALCLGARMAGRPGAHLTIIRFLPAADGNNGSCAGGDPQSQKAPAAAEERRLDDELLGELRYQLLDSESAVYMERVVSSGEETVAAVRELGSSPDLFIVGRSIGVASVLTSGLADWSDCPELGAVGDTLASSDFSSTSSVLVVQQYVEAAEAGGSGGGGEEREQYLQNPDREVTPTATGRTSFSTWRERESLSPVNKS